MQATITRAVLLAVLAFGGSGSATAQSYPSRPITIVCGQPPGTGPDIMSHMFAEAMSPSMGQRVLVSNRTGSGGIIAGQVVAQSAPDG